MTPGYLLFAADIRKEGSIADVQQTMQGVLEGIVKEPPNKEELDRVLTRRKKDFELLFNNPQRVALLMSEWASMGDWRLMFLDRDRTEKLTPQDIARVAQRYLKASNLTVGRFTPVGGSAGSRDGASGAGRFGDAQQLRRPRGGGAGRSLRSDAREH